MLLVAFNRFKIFISFYNIGGFCTVAPTKQTNFTFDAKFHTLNVLENVCFHVIVCLFQSFRLHTVIHQFHKYYGNTGHGFSRTGKVSIIRKVETI
jgi:hypothetical protein